MDITIQQEAPYDQIIAYNDVISKFVGVSLNTNIDDKVKSNIQTIYESYMNALSSSLLLNASAASNNVTISSPNMQIVVTTMLPVNSISSLSSGPLHEISIVSNNRRLSLFEKHVPFLMSVTRASMYSTTDPNNSNTTSTNSSLNLPYYKLVSNPMYLRLDCSVMNNTIIKLVLHNYVNQSLFDHVAPITEAFTTDCIVNNQTTHTYNCHYLDGSVYTLSVPCYGNSSYKTITKCPLRMRKPVCRVMSNLGSCELLEYNSERFVCSCSICSSNDYHARRLDTSSFAYQVGGAFEFLYDNYISTMTDGNKLTGSNRQNKPILFLNIT
jgi:hypothetical protein